MWTTTVVCAFGASFGFDSFMNHPVRNVGWKSAQSMPKIGSWLDIVASKYGTASTGIRRNNV